MRSPPALAQERGYGDRNGAGPRDAVAALGRAGRCREHDAGHLTNQQGYNTIANVTAGRNAEEAINSGDTRISYVDAKKLAQDGGLQFYNQTEYKSWAAPVRLASGLEARYIAAEAKLKTGNPADALALIAERRTAGKQDAFTDTGDAVLAELMAQRSRDFWLEGKRMGDWRRNPNSVPDILPTGPTGYYQSTVSDKSVGAQMCWPMPFAEKNANPNL